jgi:hypothetical protein
MKRYIGDSTVILEDLIILRCRTRTMPLIGVLVRRRGTALGVLDEYVVALDVEERILGDNSVRTATPKS